MSWWMLIPLAVVLLLGVALWPAVPDGTPKPPAAKQVRREPRRVVVRGPVELL